MKILDDIVVIMCGLLARSRMPASIEKSLKLVVCGLLAADACLPKDSFSVQSNVTTEFQATSRKDRDRRVVKKLCSSQDPVKQNSRCALFQIINYCNYFYYTHYVFKYRFVSILVSQITCGRTTAQLSPSLLIPWVISFVLPPCVLDGFHTSGTTIRMELQPLDQPLERALW
jgi:hypothetical protein